jgi:hypothetical protein
MSETAADGTTWLDDRQVAVLLGVRRSRVHELRGDHSGSFPRARHDAAGLVWSRAELIDWAEAQGITPSTKALPVATGPAREWGRGARLLPGLIAGLAVLGVSILMYQQRLSDHVTNVDDYLYARQTAAFLSSFTSNTGTIDSWRAFAINSPLVPTLATPLSAADPTPSNLVLVQLPLVLGLLVALAALFRRLGLGVVRWGFAALLAVAPPVLTYTAMLSFSIAATLGVVTSLLAYLVSERLRVRSASIWLGISFGLLSLSRVVALVYLAMLLVPMALDLLLDREDLRYRIRNGTITLGVATVIATPWWLTAGPRAMKYLLDAGYSSDSVFTNHKPLLSKLHDRLTHTADETGWLLALAVLVVFVVGLALAAWKMRRDADEASRAAVLAGLVCVVGMAFLGTSSNSGTAFALPYVVLMSVVGVAGVARALDRTFLPLRVLLGSATAVGLALSTVAVFSDGQPSTWGHRQLWLSGTPARAQFESALGCTSCALPDAGSLNRRVYAVIGKQPTVILRDDALVNPESLRFLGEQADAPVDLAAPPGAALDPALLKTASFAIGGHTAAPYLGVDLNSTDAVLKAAGFCPVLTEQLSPANSLVLWSHTCA